jgi:hypothetical protein
MAALMTEANPIYKSFDNSIRRSSTVHDALALRDKKDST